MSASRPPTDREARLKAALKANIARRKAQARARSGQQADRADHVSAQDDRHQEDGADSPKPSNDKDTG